MLEKHPPVTSLATHKQRLVVESELNRAEFGHEWKGLCEVAGGLADEAQSFAAPVLAAGSAVQEWLFEGRAGKTSWLGALINGARHGISLWLALRSRYS